MVRGPTKSEAIAYGMGILTMANPGITQKVAKTTATSILKAAGKGIKRLGWPGVILSYAIYSNPQRPTDIYGPVNIGFTPTEREVGEAIQKGIDYIRDLDRRRPAISPPFSPVGPGAGIPPFIPLSGLAMGMPQLPTPKKRRNRFGTAVGKAIRAIKGKVKNPKKAFTIATKQASRVSKGKKKPKGNGVAVKAWVAAKGAYPDYVLRQAMKR